MVRKAGSVIRVGASGYRAARELHRKVQAEGWGAVGVDGADVPKRVTLGAVVAAVLVKAARDIRLGYE